MKVTLPVTPQPWWELFLSTENGDNNCNKDLSTAANAILGLLECERKSPSCKDFLPSMVKEGSFNDPDSFLAESRT